ncbi:MAG: hypothetical protein M1837_002045 [Sclerophora amabilis]|nr:MAG: hypothetical protein M1837_002045 [Sclerophora amabilis]
MSSGPDPSSFTARRSAASNLPNFQLPPPELSSMQRFPPFAAMNANQTCSMNSGNLLTPPTNISGDGLSPISSSVNSGSSGSNPGGPPYTPVGYWAPPTSSASPYGFNNVTAPQHSFAAHNMNFGGRSMLSPSMASLGRNSSNSPSAGDGLSLPPPPYDLSLPPFPTSMSMSGPGGQMSASLPNLAAQQQAMANVLINTQTPVTSSHSQTPPTHAPDSFQPPKHPSTPSYYGGAHPASAPPQQTHFSHSYQGQSPQQSPASAVSASRISPLPGSNNNNNNNHNHNHNNNNNSTHPPILQPAPTPSSHHFSRPFSYSLPAMPGPIMSNVHSPGSQLSLVGGMSGGMMSGYPGPGGMAHLYGGHPHAQQQQHQNERPFKCDVCPQSFNRNHDLKRHKRIHLAVKPFPCGHCEKSFSRKDALKRHILVKGCGKTRSSTEPKQDGSLSPLGKSELLSSDDGDESPVLNGNPAKVDMR